jgi:hypothetical protein
MYLIFTIDGKTVYYQVPDFHVVLQTHLNNQPPQHARDKAGLGSSGGDYSQLIGDASIVVSIKEVAKDVSDAGVREALLGGVKTAIQALQKSAGKNVTIKE